MNDFLISTETTCDLNLDYLHANEVRVINMEYMVDGVLYGGDTGLELTSEEFYNKMASGAKTSTSMINEIRAEKFFRELLSEGKDVLHIAFASACSGTYECLKRAAEKLNGEFENKIYVIDSKAESTGEGLVVDLAVTLRNNGTKIEDAVKTLEDKLTRVNLLFTVDNLKYLANGGRVSKSVAFVSNIAKIKPLLYVNDDGKLTIGSKIIGRRASLTKLANMAAEKFNGEYDKIYVSHAACEDDANYVISLIKSRIPNAEIVKEQIGFVIGSHSGPGTLAIFFLGHDRKFN